MPLAMKQPQADIAIARLSEPLTVRHPLPPTMDGLFSQDVLLLGFPYGLATVAGAADRLAFVKKGVLSAREEANGVKIHYLDGHNNRGFSGGPVIAVNPSADHAQVCAVVSGYRFDEQPVYLGTRVISELATQVNAGIVISTDITRGGGNHRLAKVDVVVWGVDPSIGASVVSDQPAQASPLFRARGGWKPRPCARASGDLIVGLPLVSVVARVKAVKVSEYAERFVNVVFVRDPHPHRAAVLARVPDVEIPADVP